MPPIRPQAPNPQPHGLTMPQAPRPAVNGAPIKRPAAKKKRR